MRPTVWHPCRSSPMKRRFPGPNRCGWNWWRATCRPDRTCGREAASGTRLRLTARELNVLLTWAAGGTPSGDPAKAAAAVTDASPRRGRWGRRTEVWRCPVAWICPRTRARGQGSVLPLGPRPAAPGRRGFAARAAGDCAKCPHLDAARTAVWRSRQRALLGLWVPGDEPALLPDGRRVAGDAGCGTGGARSSYRKRWDREREAASDESAVALYAHDGPPVAGPSRLTLRAENGGQRRHTRRFRSRSARPCVCSRCGPRRRWPEPPFVWRWCQADGCALVAGDASRRGRDGNGVLAGRARACRRARGWRSRRRGRPRAQRGAAAGTRARCGVDTLVAGSAASATRTPCGAADLAWNGLAQLHRRHRDEALRDGPHVGAFRRAHRQP